MKRKNEKSKKSTVRIVVICIFLSIMYLSFIDHFSLVKVIKAKLKTSRLESKLAEVNKANEELKDKNESLKKSDDEIERIAREQFGYRKKDENEVRFIDKKEIE